MIDDEIQSARVRTRRVHYFSGFDPRGAAHYHRLYREESAKQSVFNKSHLSVRRRERLNDFVSAWQVDGDWEGEETRTDYQFMHWDDLVRSNWQRNSLLLWGGGLWPYVRLLTCGAWMRIRRIARPVAISGVFPLALFTVCLLSGFLVSLIVFALTLWLGIGWFWAIPAALIPGVLILWIGLRLAEKLGAEWLLRTFLFVYQWGIGGGRMPLDSRLDCFAKHIVEEQSRDPVDEVVLVGHSIGTMVAVDVAARLSLPCTEPDVLPVFKLLTLGQCIPVLSYIPDAVAFRDSLSKLATSGKIPWIDVTIPPDPLCFYKLDPVKVSGIEAPPCYAPKLAIARVFRMFRPETYSTLRWNKLRLHFQYLMASEVPADYDYFLTTAGPMPLAESLARCEVETAL